MLNTNLASTSSLLFERFCSLDTENLRTCFEASTRLYKALFNEELELETQNIFTKLQHLLAALPVAAIFVDRQEVALGCDNFFKNLGNSLEVKLKAIAGRNPHWSFSNVISPERKKILNETPHTIVITDSELSNAANKDLLQDLLSDEFTDNLLRKKERQGNDESHTIVLDIGNASFVDKKVLHLAKENMPSGTTHLILTNRAGNITSLGDGFLKEIPCLQTLSSCGFINLTHMGNDVLRSAWCLRFFDMTGMPKITHLGHNFLYNCERLPELDTRPLASLTHVGDSFLRDCKSFQGINIKNLIGIIHMGPWSLERNLLTEDQKKEIKEHLATRNITWQG